MNKYTESLMKLFLMKFLHWLSFWLCTVVSVAGATIDRSWLDTHYEKTEVMIPMRDDTHLYTSIYSPKQFSRKSPILIRRTPYGCAYDGNWRVSLWISVRCCRRGAIRRCLTSLQMFTTR